MLGLGGNVARGACRDKNKRIMEKILRHGFLGAETQMSPQGLGARELQEDHWVFIPFSGTTTFTILPKS